jgi:hypothetical protein
MRALLLVALALTACQTTWREGAITVSASGRRDCAKHHIPLITIPAYTAPSGWPVHEERRPYYNIVGQRCPNHMPEDVAALPTAVLHVPTTVTFCPLCENDLNEGLRVLDQKAAVSFAAYALPIYGGSGVVTAPPYQVSLRKGIWTVSCRLVDGRSAVIKISKEKGSVISTVYGKHSSNQTMKLTATLVRFGHAFLSTTFLSPKIGLSPGGRSLSFSR